MRKSVPQIFEVFEPGIKGFEMFPETCGKAFPDGDVAWSKPHKSAWDRLSLNPQIASERPNPGQIVERAEGIEHESLNADRGVDDLVR